MSEKTNKKHEKILTEDEIDLVGIAKVIWMRKWLIVKMMGLFVILGFIVAFTSPKEYEVSCTLIPEAIQSGGKIGGSLGGLASLAGVDFGELSQGGTTINPGLYRSIAQSTPFLLELMNQEFFFEGHSNRISLLEYYSKHYKTSLVSKALSIPRKLVGLVKSSSDESAIGNNDESEHQSIIFLSKKQQAVADNLAKRIRVSIDRELNIVSVEVKMQDPIVAAQIAKFTRDYITNYVTDYSVSKSQDQLKFINGQYIERKKEFERAQLRLATFRDSNTNVNSARARSEEDRLQSEYNLTFNIYNQLAQQQENIKLQVNENTPVFTVLEPIKVPNEKSEPRRMFILSMFMFLGVIMGIGIVIFKNILIK